MFDGSNVGHYVNKNHPISDYYLIDTMMLHHSASYNTTLWHLDLTVKVNDEVIYQYFVTGNNMSTLHLYMFRKKGEARNDNKVKTGCFFIQAPLQSFYP